MSLSRENIFFFCCSNFIHWYDKKPFCLKKVAWYVQCGLKKSNTLNNFWQKNIYSNNGLLFRTAVWQSQNMHIRKDPCSKRNTEGNFKSDYQWLKLITYWVHPRFLRWSVLLIFFSFLCFPIMCRYLLSSKLWCPLQFPHKNVVQLVFTSSCL